MSRAKKREQDALFDRELADVPGGARWREWMGRVEAAIFAARDPVPREALAKLVGQSCKLDDLIADIRDELRARPYDLVFVAGGYQLRTKPRFADAIRAAPPPARADADRAAGGDGDRLPATRHAGANLAACREGHQQRRHQRAEARRPHRRRSSRTRARRAFRLCHDEEGSIRGLWPCLSPRSARRRAARGRGAFATAAVGLDLDDALGISGDSDELFADAMELDEADEG